MNICDINDKKPEISYPTFWEYKVVFNADEDARAAIYGVVGTRQHKVEFSKFSRDKKYASYDLSVLVLNEQERLEIFSGLKHTAKYVL